MTRAAPFVFAFAILAAAQPAAAEADPPGDDLLDPGGPALSGELKAGLGTQTFRYAGQSLADRTGDLEGEVLLDAGRLTAIARLFLLPETRYARNWGGELEADFHASENHGAELRYRFARQQEDEGYVSEYNRMLVVSASWTPTATATGTATGTPTPVTLFPFVLPIHLNDSQEHTFELALRDRFGAVESELRDEAAFTHYLWWNGYDTDHIVNTLSHRLRAGRERLVFEMRNEWEVQRHAFAGLLSAPPVSPTAPPLTPTPTSSLFFGLTDTPTPQADYHRYEFELSWQFQKAPGTGWRLSNELVRQATDSLPPVDEPLDNYWQDRLSASLSDRGDAGGATLTLELDARSLDVERTLTPRELNELGLGFFGDTSYLSPDLEASAVTAWSPAFETSVSGRIAWLLNSQTGRAQDYAENQAALGAKWSLAAGTIGAYERFAARRYAPQTRQEDYNENRLGVTADLRFGKNASLNCDAFWLTHKIVGGSAIAFNWQPDTPTSLSTTFSGPGLSLAFRWRFASSWTWTATAWHAAQAHEGHPEFDQGWTSVKTAVAYTW